MPSRTSANRLPIEHSHDQWPAGVDRGNLEDEAFRAFTAAVPQVNQWDDHEVANGWYGGEVLDDPRRREQRVDVLVPRAKRAFFEWVPTHPRVARRQTVYRRISHGPLLDVFVVDMRTFRDPNASDRYAAASAGAAGLPTVRAPAVDVQRQARGSAAWSPRRGAARMAGARARRVDRHVEGARQ